MRNKAITVVAEEGKVAPQTFWTSTCSCSDNYAGSQAPDLGRRQVAAVVRPRLTWLTCAAHARRLSLGSRGIIQHFSEMDACN
jgi:hypothetical protein